MAIKFIISGALTALFCCQSAWAGDAVAVGFNSDGVWAALTYNRSSTPQGGDHYRDAVEATKSAVRDLNQRSNTRLVRIAIIGKSDDTGYVAIAHGTIPYMTKNFTVIGRGQSQAEADRKALQKLKERQATENEKIIYRYFSYGADSAPPASAKPSLVHTG